MARLRSAAQRAPQTLEQALAIADLFAARDAERATHVAHFEAELQKLKAAADAVLLPIDAELKDYAKQLKPYWAANIDALTGGKRKSYELGGCVIGYRISPPAVHFAHGTDQVAARALKEDGLAKHLRVTIAPDKPAILHDLEGDDTELAARLDALGFSIRQREDFFIERADAQNASTRVAEDAGA